MRGVNKVILIGNLGREPDLQHLEGNIAVAKFPLATTETYKDKTGTLISQTEWHTVVLWRGLADLAQKYLHKGSLIYLEGRIKTRTWEDKDKNRRFSTEIIGDNLVMLDKRKENHDPTPIDSAVADNNGFADMNFDPNTADDNMSKDDMPF
ncbi:MAG: single-stranded DNA-binding protein [Taibaiella sp.]|nr:single-stranded DNA-binding protein [Taibaiella sp.]